MSKKNKRELGFLCPICHKSFEAGTVGGHNHKTHEDETPGYHILKNTFGWTIKRVK